MAEFTATVSESVRVFGVAPSNKWGDYAWNSFIWGEGTAQIPVFVVTSVEETQGSTSDLEFVAAVQVGESMVPTAGLDDVNVIDNAGYYRVFPDRTTDGEERTIPNWSAVSTSSASWATATITAIVWS